MTTGMRLKSIEKSGFVNVAAEGHLSGEDNENPLMKLLGPTWASQRVLLDMTSIDWLESKAIGWLIGCQRAFKRDGGALVVHSASPRVRQLLKMLNVASLIPMADNESAGRQLLTGTSE